MEKKIKRVELMKDYGDESDLGIVYITEIHAYDENDEEILTNDFVNSYNRDCECKFFQEDDDDTYNKIRSDFAKGLCISIDLIC